MIRRMADRLVAVDLLGPASDLLKYQIDKRLDGVARAQVATRLAMIYLMDQKPQKALDTIRDTQISTLPDDLHHQRMLVEARALAGLKRWEQRARPDRRRRGRRHGQAARRHLLGKRQLGDRGAGGRAGAGHTLERRSRAERGRAPGRHARGRCLFSGQ